VKFEENLTAFGKKEKKKNEQRESFLIS